MTDVALKFKAVEDGLEAQFKKVNAQLDGLKQNADKVGSAIGTAFKAIGAIAAVKAIGAVVGDLVGLADGFVKVNVQTGIAINKVQELSFIAGQADVAFESLTGGIARMQRALVSAEEGQRGSAEALEQLGIEAQSFFSLKPDEQFERVAIAVSSIEDPAVKTDRVMDLLGKSGAELIPVLDAVGKNANELGARFDLIGGPVAEQAILRLDELGDSATAAKVAAQSLGIELLAIVSPTIVDGLNAISLTLGSFRHAVTGGSNELVNISDRIIELEAFIAKPRGYFTFKGYQNAIRKARAEIEELQGRYEILTRSFVTRSADVVLPELDTSGLRFEETDDARKEREDLEEMQLRQRAENRANARLFEMSAQIDHESKMADIEQEALNDSVDRYMEANKVKLDITTEYEDLQQQIREVFNLQAIELKEIKNQSIFGLAVGLFMDLARENTKFAKIQQGIALAQTIYATATGIMKAFQTLPWPANIIAAGKVALVGAIQVAKIKSTNYQSGGGSAPSVSGGSVSSASERAPPVPAAAVADTRGSTAIYISGFITNDVVQQMVGAIRQEFDRDVIVIPTNSLQAQVIRNQA